MNEDEIVKKLGIRNYDFRLVIGRTRIDYDRDKEDENRKKHGYSLESAVFLLERVLLLDTKPFITSDPFKENDEVRHMHMSVDDSGYIVFMVTTMRPNETVRVLSFRRASEKERAIFSELTGFNESIQRP